MFRAPHVVLSEKIQVEAWGPVRGVLPPVGQALQQLRIRVLLWPFPFSVSLGTCGAPEAPALAALYSKAMSLGPLNLERWIWMGRVGWTWAWFLQPHVAKPS